MCRGQCPVSATVGDLPPSGKELRHAILRTADSGVDYIKFGVFGVDNAPALFEVLGDLTGEHKLIAVCFADRFDPITLLQPLATLGCYGVMLDTADKFSKSLTQLLTASQLTGFVHQARSLGLLCGLAGKLQLGDIRQLFTLSPDYLGFRSALCAGERNKQLDRLAMARIRRALPRSL
jgi:(5-formylfuran-3-yl)methyl phosphate synthase